MLGGLSEYFGEQIRDAAKFIASMFSRWREHARGSALETQAIMEHTPLYKLLLLYSFPVFALIATVLIFRLLKIRRPPSLSMLGWTAWTNPISFVRKDPEATRYVRLFMMTYTFLAVVVFVILAWLVPLERPLGMGR